MRGVLLRQSCGIILGLALLPGIARAQQPVRTVTATSDYAPPTASDRLNWVIQGSVSLPVIGVNGGDSVWLTHVNTPREWGQTVEGFGRRFGDAEAYATISDAIEASTGAIWGEDPRYQQAGPRSTWRRVHHAVMAVVLAPRPDGHLAPAWGRFAAIGAATEIENSWLPPSVRTTSAIAWRVADDLMGRVASNLFDEFWPDIRRYLPVIPK